MRSGVQVLTALGVDMRMQQLQHCSIAASNGLIICISRTSRVMEGRMRSLSLIVLLGLTQLPTVSI